MMRAVHRFEVVATRLLDSDDHASLTSIHFIESLEHLLRYVASFDHCANGLLELNIAEICW